MGLYILSVPKKEALNFYLHSTNHFIVSVLTF